MTHCTHCGAELDDVARYANAIVCSACAFETGEMKDGEAPEEPNQSEAA